jgi:glycosyltransferase involved in cell wall biosynthesis
LKISVITATFNSAATIESTIRSVIDQDHPDIEYIVVDGGSTDGTLDIVRRYTSRISRLIVETDRGIYDALNKGIAAASGDLISILHSDDFFIDTHVLGKYVELFRSTRADAAYSDLFYVDRSDTDKIVRKWKSGTYSPDAFYNGWMPPHPTFIVKKEIYARYGVFDLRFRTAADYELMLRFILKHGISLAYLPEFTIKMRVGGVSNAKVKNRIAANREDRRAWSVNGLTPKFYTLLLKPLRKLVQFL